MRVIRVFPRKTRATPDDPLAYVGEPDLFAKADEVHISVAFTWDLPEAERLAKQWERVAPVKIGGPATGQASGWFTPGLYIRPGYVITSRGCPNKCWFCSVWRREGDITELPIHDGWNVLDDNLLACSPDHIAAVFQMLSRQGTRAQFTGGLEAARLRDWHVDQLAHLTPRPVVFFAYDTPDDWEPLVVASRKMLQAGFTSQSHRLRCYVLIGHPKDTLPSAEERLSAVARLGVMPMAMLWKDSDGEADAEWRRFQRKWARPAIMSSHIKQAS